VHSRYPLHVSVCWLALLNTLQKRLNDQRCSIKHTVSYVTAEDSLIKLLSDRNMTSTLHSICSTEEYGHEMDFGQMGYIEWVKLISPEIKLPG
jgi:hypothetical protein